MTWWLAAHARLRRGRAGVSGSALVAELSVQYAGQRHRGFLNHRPFHKPLRAYGGIGQGNGCV